MERKDRIDSLMQSLDERIVLLDGAMGTMIQGYGLAEEDYRGERFRDASRDLKGNNDLLTLTRPSVIRDIHTAFLEAGADIIETNTFNANAPSMADYGMEDLVVELNLAAARLARECADEHAKRSGSPRYVAGVLGPTNRTASISTSESLNFPPICPREMISRISRAVVRRGLTMWSMPMDLKI